MKLTDDIIAVPTSDQPNLSVALLRTKVLAHKMKAAEVAQRAHFKSAGRPKNVEVPDDRHFGMLVRGTLIAGHTFHSIETSLSRREAYLKICMAIS